jgi:hypothetical protein
MNERPIPDVAQRDVNAVEMLRVWVAEEKLHCSLKVGMYREATEIEEEIAWGTILADAARHIAIALSSGYGVDEQIALGKIRARFNEELASPSSDAIGGFV